MKLVERDFVNQINVSAAVALWNHWDHEHLTVVHQNYTDCKILYEKGDAMVQLVTYKVPIFSFILSHSMGTVIMLERKGSGGVFQQYNQGLFGIPSITTIDIEEVDQDNCIIRSNYKFILYGWTELLAPLLYKMMEKWNRQVWLEDLPLKLRRHKVLHCGFKDFVGLPEKVADRLDNRRTDVRIPLPRPADSPVNLYLNTFLKRPGSHSPGAE